MSGLTGVFLFRPLSNADAVVRIMSESLQHRGVESVQRYSDLTHPEREALIAIRRHERDNPVIESDLARLIIVDSLFSATGHLDEKTSRHSDTFNVLSLRIDSSGLRVFRSMDGTQGFYYSRLNEGIVFASERKSIWRITRMAIDALEPGHVLSASWSGDIRTSRLTSFTSSNTRISEDSTIIVSNLRKLLNASVRKMPREKCGVLFSGGVDSSLAALLTMRRCSDTLLLTAVCRGSHDKAAATKAAESLMAKHTVMEISETEIWEALPEVMHAIETSNRMQVEIALPFFFAAREAKRRGYDLLVSGQGPDELFAGYARYVTLMKSKGTKAVEEALVYDVSVTHEVNIQRDVRAVAANGVNVFFPYLYPPFVRAALALPATLKVDLDRGPVRKSIFRELAASYGLSSEITEAPKHATQYSSGTAKALTSAILQRYEGGGQLDSRAKAAVVQGVLDTIARRLEIPTTDRSEVLQIDLGPTARLLKRLECSASSNER
jgi:asparagine synthetase B (glutamine-hydrolysing)